MRLHERKLCNEHGHEGGADQRCDLSGICQNGLRSGVVQPGSLEVKSLPAGSGFASPCHHIPVLPE
jgi:hypothetical protein